MTLNLSVDEVLTTTRSVRKRLDFDKPVPRDVLMECLELALQAPTGSNSQGWQWVFVEDAAKKKAIADVYLANARGYLSGPELQRLARLWPDGLLALLEPRIGRRAANAVTVFFDGATLHALITGTPLSTDELTDAIARLVADGPEQREVGQSAHAGRTPD